MIRLKTRAEIEILREGGHRHAVILRALSDTVRPGLALRELEAEAERLISEGGDRSATLGYTPLGARRPFPANLCVSVNEEIVHGIPSESTRLLAEGDIVSIDLSLVHRGLTTDAAVTVPVGTVDDTSKRLITATRLALEQGIAAAKPGNHTGDIGEAISDYVETTGFAVAEDLAGHGVGYALHEEPFVPNIGRAGTGERLVPGLVIAIEPMLCAGQGRIKLLGDDYTIVTRDGSRSAHFEHTVAITETGNIVLTQG